MSPSSPPNTRSGFSQQYPGTNFCLSQDSHYCDKDHSQYQAGRYFILFLGNSVVEGNAGRNWYLEPESSNYSLAGLVFLLMYPRMTRPREAATTVGYDFAHKSLIMETSYRYPYRQSHRIMFLTNVSFLLITSQCHTDQNTSSLDKSQIPNSKWCSAMLKRKKQLYVVVWT